MDRSSITTLIFLLLCCSTRTLASLVGLNVEEMVLTNLDLNPVTNMRLFVDHHNEAEKESRALDSEVLPSLRYLDDGNAQDYVDALACGFCKKNLTIGATGVIESPLYPEPYTANVDCLWLLQTANIEDRIVLNCDTIELEPCGSNEGTSPEWRDYLVISPLWSFKKSWLYCGNATNVRNVKHTSLCHKMALSFRANNNHNCNKGFHCTYQVI